MKQRRKLVFALVLYFDNWPDWLLRLPYWFGNLCDYFRFPVIPVY